jgi:hypothetical protein
MDVIKEHFQEFITLSTNEDLGHYYLVAIPTSPKFHEYSARAPELDPTIHKVELRYEYVGCSRKYPDKFVYELVGVYS